MKKIPLRAHRTAVARRGRAKPNFCGNRLIVCRITGKNGAEFKNHVENWYEQTRAKRGVLRV